MWDDVIKLLQNKINKSFKSWYFHDAIKSSLILLDIDSENVIWKKILEKSKKELYKEEPSNKLRNDVIKEIENHIDKSFNERRFHEVIKLSLVLLNIDSKNIIWKKMLEKSKVELSELSFSQWYIYWYSSYLDTIYDPFNYDPYQKTIYLTFEDWYNSYKQIIKTNIKITFSIVFIVIIFFALIYFF